MTTFNVIMTLWLCQYDLVPIIYNRKKLLLRTFVRLYPLGEEKIFSNPLLFLVGFIISTYYIVRNVVRTVVGIDSDSIIDIGDNNENRAYFRQLL